MQGDAPLKNLSEWIIAEYISVFRDTRLKLIYNQVLGRLGDVTMAFMQKDIHILITGSTTVWSYRTDDTAVKVSARGYFENFRECLAVGNWILATTSTGGIMLHVDEIDPLELGVLR